MTKYGIALLACATTAFAAAGQSRDDAGLTIRHCLAPGQKALYRIQSDAAAKKPFVSDGN